MKTETLKELLDLFAFLLVTPEFLEEERLKWFQRKAGPWIAKTKERAWYLRAFATGRTSIIPIEVWISFWIFLIVGIYLSYFKCSLPSRRTPAGMPSGRRRSRGRDRRIPWRSAGPPASSGCSRSGLPRAVR
jgi:hypothetical protein